MQVGPVTNLSLNFKALKLTTCVEEALKYLNESIRVVVVDEKGFFLGTLTDGDIRRHLLKSGNLQDEISICANFNAIFTDSESKAFDLFTATQAPYIVITNDDKIPTKILDTRVDKSPIKTAFIMAGGKGTRLRPITNSIPKPLVKVGGIPLIDRVISRLRKYGISNLFISVNYMADKIIEHFNTTNFSDVDIHFVKEEKYLGTAGALSLLKAKINHDFLVVNADVITDINYTDLSQYHLNNKANITIVAKDHKIQNPYGVLDIQQNRVLNIIEKPVYESYVAAGVYVISAEFLNSTHRLNSINFLDMPDFILGSISDGYNVVCYPIHEFWSDVGTHKAIEEFEMRANG